MKGGEDATKLEVDMARVEEDIQDKLPTQDDIRARQTNETTTKTDTEGLRTDFFSEDEDLDDDLEPLEFIVSSKDGDVIVDTNTSEIKLSTDGAQITMSIFLQSPPPARPLTPPATFSSATTVMMEVP